MTSPDLVVSEVDMRPINTFFVIFLLLQLENMLNKKLLKILVRKVDAKLFEADKKSMLKLRKLQIDIFKSLGQLFSNCVPLVLEFWKRTARRDNKVPF